MHSPLHYLTGEELLKAVAKRHGVDYKSPWLYEYVAKMLGFRPKPKQKYSITRAMFNKIFGGARSSGISSLDELNLDWDLRTPLSALGSTEGNSSGFIGMRRTDPSILDTYAIFDQSEDLSEGSTIWASDFTSGTDGYSAQLGSPVLTANQTIGGEGGWLKVDTDGTGAENSIQKSNIGSKNKAFKFKMKVYIPSSNTSVNGVRSTTGNGSYWYQDNPSIPTDQIYEITNYNFNRNTQQSHEIYTIGHTANVDTFYVKDIQVIELDGKHFVQTDGGDAACAHWDNTNLVLDSDGANDYYFDYNGRFLTAHGSDTSGAFYFSFDDITGTGTTVYPFTMGEAGVNSRAFYFGLTSSDELFLFFRDATQRNQLTFGSGLARGGRSRVYIISTGSTYRVFYNGVELTSPTITYGANDGKWIGDHGSIDYANFFRLNDISPNFYALGLKYAGYASDHTKILDNISDIDSIISV